MDAVVVQDNVNDFAGWHLGLEGIEEADELLMPVALHAAADNPAFEHIESGEQRGHGELRLFLLHTKCQGWSWAVAARRCFAIRSF